MNAERRKEEHRGDGPPSIAVARADRLPTSATLGDLVALTISKATARLVSAEPLIAEGTDPDAVHRARVAVRRLRSDLRTFRPVLDRDWTTGLRDELEWLGDLAAPVRDAEVLQGRLEETLASISGGDHGPGKAIVDELETLRLEERRRLLAGLRTDRYRELAARLVAASDDPRPRGDALDAPAADGVGLLKRPWKRLRKQADRVGPDASDPSLHRLRILAKRLRYGAEALAPALGKKGRRTAEAAEDLQEVLGEHQDAVVAIAWLSEHALATDDPAVAFTAGRLAEIESTRRDRTRREWPDIWRRLEHAHRRMG
jgi:CHAD domain-containing protein